MSVLPVTVQQHLSLKEYNTFGIQADARYYARIGTAATLQALLTNESAQALPKLVLGGGSNILLTGDFPGLVIHIVLPGIVKLREDENHVWIQAGAGVPWHELVNYCIQQGYAGIENLSFIPGTVGAAPMQNIGAYGVELCEVFDHLVAMEVATAKARIFHTSDCAFGYRESVFKHTLKGKFIILNVTLRLAKKPDFHLEYGGVKEMLTEMGIKTPTLQTVSEAIIRIRRRKLPDPAVLGNAGSFFKNPTVSSELFQKLKSTYPNIPGYESLTGKVKVPAAWLIEQCGWKGNHTGRAGVHKDHALILVNNGGATGEEIQRLAAAIQASVEQTFGIALAPEVNII